MREGIEIEVTADDRARLEAIVADRNSSQKHVWRARIILATGEGCGTAEVMRRAGVSKPCVWRWQERFMSEGVDGLLHDTTRPSRIPPLPQAVGLSVSSVQRIWRAHGLRPHQVRSFKLDRSEVRRQGRGHRRAVCRSARPCRGAVDRREEPCGGWPPARKRKVSV